MRIKSLFPYEVNKKDQLPSRIIGLFLNVLCQRTMRTRDPLILPGFIRKRMA